MTAPIVERVARAQCLACGLDPDFEVWDLNERKYRPYWTVRIPEARASIAIQRELIQQLRDALVVSRDFNQGEGRRGICTEAIAAADAALKDTP
jgi:hypothetical protein